MVLPNKRATTKNGDLKLKAQEKNFYLKEPTLKMNQNFQLIAIRQILNFYVNMIRKIFQAVEKIFQQF